MAHVHSRLLFFAFGGGPGTGAPDASASACEAVNHVRREVRKSIARGSDGESCGMDECARWSDSLRFFSIPGRVGVGVNSVSVSKGVLSDDEVVRRAEAAVKKVFLESEAREGVDGEEV